MMKPLNLYNNIFIVLMVLLIGAATRAQVTVSDNYLIVNAKGDDLV